MIWAHRLHPEKAVTWFHRFESLGVRPTARAINRMLQILATAGDSGSAVSWFERMSALRLEPNLQTYISVFDAHARAALSETADSKQALEAAERWFVRLLAQPDLSVNATSYVLGTMSTLYRRLHIPPTLHAREYLEACARVKPRAKEGFVDLAPKTTLDDANEAAELLVNEETSSGPLPSPPVPQQPLAPVASGALRGATKPMAKALPTSIFRKRPHARDASGKGHHHPRPAERTRLVVRNSEK